MFRQTFGLAVLLGFAVLFVQVSSPSTAAAPQWGPGVPAYHAEVPKGPMPATLSPKLFSDPIVQNSYVVAARSKRLFYQQPCYCYCDRSQGHGSLLDCFVSKHASGCEICIREAFYAFDQARKGRTTAQIRQGIIAGDWQNLDPAKFKTLPAARSGAVRPSP